MPSIFPSELERRLEKIFGKEGLMAARRLAKTQIEDGDSEEKIISYWESFVKRNTPPDPFDIKGEIK
jgi:hypothetical protein